MHTHFSHGEAGDTFGLAFYVVDSVEVCVDKHTTGAITSALNCCWIGFDDE